MNPKSGYTAQELADLRLVSLPQTRPGVTKKAKREGWPMQERTGRGGGNEYALSSLPAEVQAEIRERHLQALAKQNPVVVREVKHLDRDLGALSDKQRAVADARMALARYVREVEAVCKTRQEAVRKVSEMSRAGELPGELNRQCAIACARKGGKPGVGTRVLYQWLLDEELCDSGAERLRALAPQKQGQPPIALTRREWLPEFLGVYRNTNGVCIAEAYRSFAKAYAARHGAALLPSLGVVETVMSQMPAYIREQGRITGARMRALKTYVKRDWSTLRNNDVWVGDGHSLKMKVKHPDHGQPFVPELTLIMDTACRYIVGWSLSYAESCIAVADALRHAMTKNGIPAMYYSDNGGGQTNKTLDADISGIFDRLGIHHETGIPGNPLGRGIIERVMKTLAHTIARQFETYHGPGADRDTVRQIHTATASLAKAQREGKQELTPKQAWAQGKLPSWDDLLKTVAAAVRWYNEEHQHRELGGMTPAQMRTHIFAEMADDEFHPLTDVEARDMFRPGFRRVVQRGWLTVLNNQYWHSDLEAHDGETVLALIDQHDPALAIIRDLDGCWLCDAKLDGNKRAAFPESLVERSRRQRAERRLRKLDDERAKAIAETRPTLEHEKTQTLHDLLGTGGGAAEQETPLQFLKSMM